VEVSGSLKRYADIATDWQERGFTMMDRAWLRSIGVITEDVPIMRSWRELVRGAAKTWALACRAAWALEFAPRRIKINAYAGDSDQARLVVKSIQTHCDANQWHTLEIQKNVVRNPTTGSELEIMSADAATGFGALVDAIFVDEIGNWPDTDQSLRLWEMIISTATKKQSCLAEVATNAGRTESKIYEIRNGVRDDAASSDPLWYFESVKEIPNWFTPRQLAEQKRLLSPSAYARLWENSWSSGTDSGVSPTDYDACEVLFEEHPRRQREFDAYIAACDLGWRHDRTGLVVLAVNYRRNITQLAYCAQFRPQDYGGELPLSVVEEAIEEVHRKYILNWLVFDPREATGLSQRLCDRGLPCARISLTPDVQDAMAKGLLKAFNQRTIQVYPHAELRKDILSLEVVDRTIGLKLQAARTAGGHSDLGFSAAIALYCVANYEPMASRDEVLIA
jgi:hypothetical protein